MNSLTNEQLVDLLYADSQNDVALGQLINNLRPMMILLGKKHLSKIPIFDIEDYIQEGTILLWSLITKRRYNGHGKFSTLFYQAFNRKCINLYRDYVMKNLLELPQEEDLKFYGYHISYLVEAEFAVEYRKKRKEWYRKYESSHPRKKPSSQKTDEKPKLTAEEKEQRAREKRKEYYLANKERLLAAKHRWYRENHEYALQYQHLYSLGVRLRDDKQTEKS